VVPRKEEVMTDPTHLQALSTRVGLSSNAIFRLWRAAVKDDERLLDEAIAAVHDEMMSLDRARAEHVISLIIRRHRDAKRAFRAVLNANRRRRRPTTVTLSAGNSLTAKSFF
jgi:hypothetical protein